MFLIARKKQPRERSFPLLTTLQNPLLFLKISVSVCKVSVGVWSFRVKQKCFVEQSCKFVTRGCPKLIKYNSMSSASLSHFQNLLGQRASSQLDRGTIYLDSYPRKFRTTLICTKGFTVDLCTLKIKFAHTWPSAQFLLSPIFSNEHLHSVTHICVRVFLYSVLDATHHYL